jgi:sugar lactone lactonase YvrE
MRLRALCLTCLLGAVACGADHTAPSPRTPPLVAPGHIDTIVGTGNRATDPVDGDADGQIDRPIAALDANLDTPMDTFMSAAGTLYVIDWNGHKIRGLDERGMLSFVAGTGTEGDACEADETDGKCPATACELNHPTDVFVDRDNQLWIAAWHNSKIKLRRADTDLVANFCGTGNRKFEGDGGPCRDDAGADLVSFDLPSGIVVDASGNVFISDQSNQVVRRIGGDGVVTTVAGHCPGTMGFGCGNGRGYSGDGGPATAAQLNNNIGQGTGPHGKIAFDGDGNLYIADTINNAVRKVTPGSDGVLGDGDAEEELMTTVAGTGEQGYAGDDGPATAARLSRPTDLALGADGTLFIADAGNACVRRVDRQGTITTVAGTCAAPGYAGDGGLATQAQLKSPNGISVDPDGNLYIADSLNHRIRKVVLE